MSVLLTRTGMRRKIIRMAMLVDPVRLSAYRNALANWRFEGYVQWKEVARDWVRHEK